MGITRLTTSRIPSYIHISRPSRVFPRYSSSAMEHCTIMRVSRQQCLNTLPIPPSTNTPSRLPMKQQQQQQQQQVSSHVSIAGTWTRHSTISPRQKSRLSTVSKYHRARSRYAGMTTGRAIRCPSRSALRRSSRERRCSISSRVTCKASLYALEYAMRPTRSNG